MMLFGEKYGETVRVLDIGSSRELCGGTHVQRTGDIGFFTIIAEGGVAAGVRRIEAVTGLNALAYVQGMETTLGGVAGTLRVTPGEVPARISAMLEQARELEKELMALKGKLASSQGDELVNRAVDVNGIKVLAARLEGADAKALRETLDKLKDKLKSGGHRAGGGASDGKVSADRRRHARQHRQGSRPVNWSTAVAQQVGGKGGGRPDMAHGRRHPARKISPAALASVPAWVAERV
jgi:alanyl-tRNA synthetase